LCEIILVNGVALELDAITLDDVELAVVIVGGCSCNPFAENMQLFDDKDQIRINITT